MEAAPRLPMINFDLQVSNEAVQFGPKLKQYISNFYNEDPESYLTEIHNIESLRASAVHPNMDVLGVQLLKKYYCQLHFLKSRFPMEEGQACAIQFPWKDPQGGISTGDVRFELMTIMYNIGALHTYLGSQDSRSSPEGMKMACTHFQCAVWAFQTIKERFHDFVYYISSFELIHFYQQVCLAQAQECILEKSMLDNRKSTIISKVAVQVYEYYRQSLTMLKSTNDEICGRQNYKEWTKYLQFKVAYHRCISLLFQGQQAEELQKMGMRVAFYQAACEHLEEARKLLSGFKSQQQKELMEALAFTVDVVEGKRKAAKNENEFIYHEEVPDLAHLQEVKGASLVKGIAFNINDPEVSGPDIFARLVPMEAHEAASLYSEKKAQLLRNIGERVEIHDQSLAEFMSSMQLDILTKMHQATGIPQELIDRAAALSAKTNVTQNLVDAMAKLSNIYHDVEANLKEIDSYLKEEENMEIKYQEIMGKRPPSIIATDLTRETTKYKEAHNKANESNQTLSKAMMTHVENLKILQQPLRELQQKLPSVDLPDANIDENVLKELEMLNSKVDEMRTQRAMLWAQIREAVHNDDITNALVTKPPNLVLDDLFKKELDKHQQLVSLIEQNLLAQDNIKKVFVETYAKAVTTRRYIQEVIQRRSSTIHALITSYDSYDDLLGKANKGIEFYTKLEMNVSKLLQRIKSTIKVQQEEREQMLMKMDKPKKDDVVFNASSAPKLKDYLDAFKQTGTGKYPESTVPYSAVSYGGVAPTVTDTQSWPPAVRPAPVGSEINSEPAVHPTSKEIANNYSNLHSAYGQITPSNQPVYQYQYPTQLNSNTATHLSGQYQSYADPNVNDITERMNSLLGHQQKPAVSSSYVPPSSYSSYIPQNYTPVSYSNSSQYYSSAATTAGMDTAYDPNKATTTTTNYYQTISHTPNSSKYPDHSFSHSGLVTGVPNQYQMTPTSDASVVNQSSTVSYDTAQYSYYTPTQTGESSASYPANYQTAAFNNYSTSNAAASYSQPSYPQYTQTYQQAYGQQGGYVSQMAGIPAEPQSVDTQYYPPGYNPNYNSSDANLQNYYATPQYTQNYHSQEYLTSVRPDLTNYNYSTYSSPTSDMYKLHSDSAAYGVSTGYIQTPNVTHSQENIPVNTNNQQQPYASTPTTSTSSQTKIPATKESNIDLLTGLDFSVSQVPLTPQQNVPLKPKEPEPDPTVIEVKSAIVKTKEEKAVNSDVVSIKIVPSKPLSNSEVKYLINQEVDKFEKYVETLANKTLSGPTTLEVKWKEIQDSQESDNQKRIISVARCYPLKNRYADILPYDYSRVELKSTVDDYINASHVKEVSPYSPHFIITQAPLPATFGDFWTMIKEQQVELIFCLLNDSEIGDDVYWPKEKGMNLNVQNMVLSLQSVVVKSHWVERMISITIPETKESSIVMHVQFISWPGSLFPTSPEPFVSYVLELISLFQQQQNISHPVVVHCSSGIGRSGLTCLMSIAILELTNKTTSVPDLSVIASKLTCCRKNVLRDREHLKFAYESLLCYMKLVVAQDHMKKKLSEIIPKNEQSNSKPVADFQEKNIDPLSSLDPFWASKK